jgi:hypothetical protein
LEKRLSGSEVRILRKEELDNRLATMTGRPDERVLDDQLWQQGWPVGSDPLDGRDVRTQSAIRIEIAAYRVKIAERRGEAEIADSGARRTSASAASVYPNVTTVQSGA